VLALVTTDAAASVDPDLVPLDRALRSRLGGAATAVVSWDDPDVDWAEFDAVVIRSTWDYVERLGEFLTWADRVASVSRLFNSPDTIRWNANKEYLIELAAEGVPIVPTTFVRPGETPPVVEGTHVVKPTVGAGSKGARRCEPSEVAAHVGLLHAAGRTAMIQPYLELLDERGEIEHCFVRGVTEQTSPGVNRHGLVLSHAFRKGAILTSSDVEQVAGLFAKEVITACDPSEESLDLAHQVLATDAIHRLDEVTFARIDVAPLRDRHGDESLVVMEVELIEPSFYFDVTPGSADAFADRLVHLLHLSAAAHNADTCADSESRATSRVR
jgi:hypothetical protein